MDYMERNAIGKPKINIKIEYADLAKTLDYADNGWIEELELCDIVPIYYPQIGLTDETAKVTTVTYDFVNERNESVEFGDIGTNVRSTMQSGLAGKIDDIAKSQERFESNLPAYLLNAQGNKVWYNHPDNTEHKIGDIWFEKNGLYDRMYVWNGTQWEKRIDTEDVDRVKKEVNRQLEEAKTTTDRAIEQANAKAQEALTKAGTIPDTSKLSDQIKQQILSSQDLQNKVTEGIKSVDGDTIYNKIYRNIEQSFAPSAYADYLNNKLSDTKEQVSNLDRRIASQTIEFNKLTESNKLYERIIGKSETDAPDKLSRLVMSSQIFQTEVGKYSTSGGPNMIRNSRADEGLKYWNGAPNKFKFLEHQFYMNGQKRMFLLYNGAVVNSPRFIFKKNTDYMLNMLAFDANTARFTIELRKRKKDSANQDYDEIQTIFDKTGNPAFDSTKAVKKSFKFNTGDFDNGYLLFSYEGNPTGWSGLFMTELDFYEGSSSRLWQPCPDDSNEPIEAVRTQVTQLNNSWSVQNLTSAGAVLGAINLNPDGSVKINEGLISIGDKTYIKDGVIKSSMISNAQIGTAHIGEIDASTARLINVSAKNITADGMTANIIKGGILSSVNGSTFFNLNDGYFESNGTNSRIMINDGAFDFTTKSGKGIAGYSTMYGEGRIKGGAIGSHDGFDFSITTKTGARSMLSFTNDNKMIVSNSMTIVSDQASFSEYIGIKLKRYNQGGGWCTAIVSSHGSSGIEFYDNGNVRILRYGQIWEPK